MRSKRLAVVVVLALLLTGLTMAAPSVPKPPEVMGSVVLKVRDSDIITDTLESTIIATNQSTGEQFKFKTDEDGVITVKLPAPIIKNEAGDEEYTLYTYQVQAKGYDELIIPNIPAQPETQVEIIFPMFKGNGKVEFKNDKPKARPPKVHKAVSPTFDPIKIEAPDTKPGEATDSINATAEEMVEPATVRCYDPESSRSYTLATSEWLAKVVTNEWAGYTPVGYWEGEALKAGVVASRSWMYFWYLYRDLDDGVIENSQTRITWAPYANQNAINAVSAVGKYYLSGGGTWTQGTVLRHKPASTNFSSIVTSQEARWGSGYSKNASASDGVDSFPYLASIYDAADYELNLGNYYSAELPYPPYPGMSQQGSNLWAHGFYNGDTYERPQSYSQILYHYYPGIQFRIAQ